MQPRSSSLARLLVLAAISTGLLAAAPAAMADAIGDQQQISTTDGEFARQSSNAFNTQTNQWLVAWSAHTENEGVQIWGRFVDAAGNPVGTQFQISDHPNEGDSEDCQERESSSDASGCEPDVAYNSQANEFMVVWRGQNHTVGKGRLGLSLEEPRIYAQRLSATGEQLDTGNETAPGDEPISDRFAEQAGDFTPSVAYNSTDNQYFVVWHHEETGEVCPTGDGPALCFIQEIYGQRLDASGGQVGDNDFLVSDLGTNAESEWPDVAYNGVDNQYLAVWDEDIDFDEGHFEIFGQRLDTSGGKVGATNFQISDRGQNDEDANVDSFVPAVAHQPVTNQYLVVFEGDGEEKVDDFLTEVFGQLLGSGGDEVGENDFRISNTPQGKDFAGGGDEPAVAADTRSGQYLVTFLRFTESSSDLAGKSEDDPHLAGGGSEDDEVFGQYLTQSGAQTGTDDFQISSHEATQETVGGTLPATSFDSNNCQYLTSWEGGFPLSIPARAGGGETFLGEIFGRRQSAPACPVPAPPAAAPQQVAQTPPKPGRPSVRVAGVRSSCVRTSVTVSLRVTARTGATLENVRVTLDGKRIKSTSRSRSTVRINVRKLKAGRHRLRIVATDSAGNRTTVNRTITVCVRRAQRRTAPRFTG